MPAGSILIADDDAAIRTVLNQALSRAGYEVRSTSNAATLWRWVSQGDGDLVITDVVMPGVSGPELAKKLLSLRPGLRVIYMSGYAGEYLHNEGVNADGVVLLQKPFTAAALEEKIQHVLHSPLAR